MMPGISPIWFAGGLFALCYLLIMTDRFHRTVLALMAGSVMVLSGIIDQNEALEGVDFNTLGLLVGMMIIVSLTRQTGVFQFLAIWSAKRVDAKPWPILIMLVGVTAVLSAALDNVTTVLIIAPLTILITNELRIKAYPFLFAEILAANIGGTATLIGDPPNIMIGSVVGISFNDFIVNLGPIVVIILLASLPPLYLIWGRHMRASDADRQRVMAYDEQRAIKDRGLVWQSLAVLAVVLLGFVFAHNLQLAPATIAMSGASIMLLLRIMPMATGDQNELVQETLKQVEWPAVFFFVGLFILVRGVEETGLLDLAAEHVLQLTGGSLQTTAIAVIFVSAIASAIVDNIPFVATMIPLIGNMEATFGGPEQLMPIWWALSLGSCLGGNGSLVGASANIIVAGFADKAGEPIRFGRFMLVAFPMMLYTVAIAAVYLYWRYL